MILANMYRKFDILNTFKIKLMNKGYSFKQLSCVNGQLDLLRDLIEKESFNVLNELLKKTNYRLLKSLEKGNKNLVNILKCPDEWRICKVEDNLNEWLSNDALIFSTERQTLVFTKNVSCQGAKYVNNKWQ